MRFLASATLALMAAYFAGCGQEAPPPPDESAPVGVSAAPLSELIVNGTFSGTTISPWWSGPNTSSRVETGRMRVDVAGGTANLWDALIVQDGTPLVSGQTYTLAFTASATVSGTVRTTVQLGSSPYTPTLDQYVTLDGTPRRFSFPFTSSLSTSTGQVVFQFGGRAGAYTVYLDDISLTTAGGTGSGPLGMTSGFYVDPNSNPASWVRANGGDWRAPRIQSSIASKPMARWFGNWSGDITSAVSSFVGAADAADKLPVLVAYNIPARDCGSHSSGGAGSPEAYRTWINGFASGIGSRPAIVIIEPDGVALIDCLSETERQTRLGLIRYATERLRDLAPNTWTYVDAGTAAWIPADTMAQRLEAAGVRNVRGFSLNVSNYYTTAQSASYAQAVNSSLSSRYGYTRAFVVDTSRNGNGATANGEWCNPAGRKLGVTSQVGGGAELQLWVKVPGDSDGMCGIAPGTPAGQFSPDLANRLIDGT